MIVVRYSILFNYELNFKRSFQESVTSVNWHVYKRAENKMLRYEAPAQSIWGVGWHTVWQHTVLVIVFFLISTQYQHPKHAHVSFRSLHYPIILHTHLRNRTIGEVGVRSGGACENVQDERVIRISHHSGKKRRSLKKNLQSPACRWNTIWHEHNITRWWKRWKKSQSELARREHWGGTYLQIPEMGSEHKH